MVEYNQLLDSGFSSLSDPTRRDILRRVSQKELSIGELAASYDMSFAAVAKHIALLETAKLISKRKVGKQQLVSATPETIQLLKSNLEKYQQMWTDRFTALDQVLASTK